MKEPPYIVDLGSCDSGELARSFAEAKAGMYLCTSGRSSFFVNGEPREVSAGEMLVYPPYAQVALTAASDDLEGYLVVVDHEFIFSSVKSLDWSAKLHFISWHPVVCLQEKDFEVSMSLIKLIDYRSSREMNSVNKLLLSTLWKTLAYHTLAAYLEVHQIETEASAAKNTIALTFQTDLIRHFLLHREVAFYAALQHLTPRYFSAVIKEVTGHNPLYWIIQAVTGEAKKRILESSLTVKEIAYSMNFANPTFFCRWFKQYTGQTPLQFRRSAASAK